jgi:hypothetical protein
VPYFRRTKYYTHGLLSLMNPQLILNALRVLSAVKLGIAVDPADVAMLSASIPRSANISIEQFAIHAIEAELKHPLPHEEQMKLLARDG